MKWRYFYHEHLADYAELKAKGLVSRGELYGNPNDFSEFSFKPFLEDFQREYVNHRPARCTGQLNYAASLRYIVGKLGGKSPESTIKTLAEHRQSAFTAHLRCIEPEILDMLDEITASGVRLGLISNTDGSEVLDWANSPLVRFFEVTIFSHAVKIVKPEPDIYQHACRNLGIAPSDCIFIGDGNSDELRGAAQVGMSPFCAAWFLRQHTDLLGEDIMMRRAVGYPVLYHPSEVADLVNEKVVPHTETQDSNSA